MTTTTNSTPSLEALRAKAELTADRRAWALDAVRFEDDRMREAVRDLERAGTARFATWGNCAAAAGEVTLRATHLQNACRKYLEALTADREARQAVRAAERRAAS